MNDEGRERNTRTTTAGMPLIAVVIVFVIVSGFLAPIWFKEAGSHIAKWILSAIAVTAHIVVLSSLRKAEDSERAVIFFLGQFQMVRGSGRFLALPLIQRVVNVNLDEHIPDWRGLDEGEISRIVSEIAVEADNHGK
jgi:hypothetical protein